MYISSRRKAGEKESIAGVTDDFLGEAVFVGELGSGYLKFTEKYSTPAINMGASKNGIEYQGKKVGDKYKGEYVMINKSGVVPSDCSRPFVLERCIFPLFN